MPCFYFLGLLMIKLYNMNKLLTKNLQISTFYLSKYLENVIFMTGNPSFVFPGYFPVPGIPVRNPNLNCLLAIFSPRNVFNSKRRYHIAFNWFIKIVRSLAKLFKLKEIIIVA